MSRTPEKATLKRFAIKNVVREAETDPDRILLYGEEGIGKTTFGSEAPKPIFLPTEVRFRGIEVDRMPRIESWDDMLAALTVVEEEKHDWQTICVDTLDALEPLIHDVVCEREGWESIGEPGWRKGEQAAVELWREFLVRIDRIRLNRKMEVILLAHGRLGNFKDPESEGWQFWEPAIDKAAYGLFGQWADSILFGQFERFAVKLSKGKGAKRVGRSSGRRVLRTRPSATWRAKDTYGLPPELPMSYHDYVAARGAGQPKPSAELWAELEELLGMLPEDVRAEREPALRKYAEQSSRNLAAAVERVRQAVSEYVEDADEDETQSTEES